MADSPLRCIVVTPEETAVDTTAESVTLPLFDGELGVLQGHAPMIGRLGYGELRIRSSGNGAGGETTRLFVDGGFAQIADNVVSVMTGRAIPVAQVDKAEAEQALSEALAISASGTDAVAYREKEVARARGMIHVASKG